MAAENKLAQDSGRTPSLGQGNEPGVVALLDATIRFTPTKYADMKAVRIQTPDNLAGIAHLGIGKTPVGQAVHEDAHRGHT